MRLTDEFPEVWVTSRPSAARGKNARAIVVLESVAPNADQAEGRVAAALDRLLALVSGAY